MVRSFESGRSAHDRVLVLLEGEERREFFQDFVFEQARRAIDHYVRIRFRGAITRKTRSRSPSWRPLSDKHAFNVEEVIEVIRDCVAYYDERAGRPLTGPFTGGHGGVCRSESAEAGSLLGTGERERGGTGRHAAPLEPEAAPMASCWRGRPSSAGRSGAPGVMRDRTAWARR